MLGALVFVLVAVGTGLAGDATWYRLELKLQDYFIASPLYQTTFLLGMALAGLFFSAPALVVLIPILVYRGLPLVSIPLAMLAVGAVWLFSAAIGYLASTYVSNLLNGWQSGLLLSVIVGILPPAFYPAEVLPSNLLWVAYLVPTTHTVLLLRALGQTISLAGWSPLVGWAVLAAMLLLALPATSRAARWPTGGLVLQDRVAQHSTWLPQSYPTRHCPGGSSAPPSPPGYSLGVT